MTPALIFTGVLEVLVELVEGVVVLVDAVAEFELMVTGKGEPVSGYAMLL